jgi:aspartyl-tRNA(Asn)/glutamyl-tRNA(Gln) amidotransferase subunit B
VESLRAALPEPPAARRRRLQEAWGLSDLDMRDIANAGAVDLVEATVAAGAPPAAARKWWTGELSRHANTSGTELAELPVTPAQVAALQALVDGGRLNDKLARAVLEGVLAGEGDPEQVADARGLGVVSDDGALLEAVDAALAASPDVAEKIRSGKVAAAGAVVGAVMKATRGQADAARVRELVLERVGVTV